jgi:hypothetical protein
MRKLLAKQFTTKHNFSQQICKDVPNIIHFIYGFLPQTKPFEYYKYIAILSAYTINKPDTIYFYYQHEPFGPFWDKVKSLLTLQKITPPISYNGVQIRHYAHQADLLRLQLLYQYGGIYLDIDTICIKPFTPLLTYDITLGYQGDHGLCNAVIIAKPRNSFILSWIQSYSTFRSCGKDQYYDEHSVILPMKLALQRTDVNVLPDNAFFFPLAEHIENVLFNNSYTEENKNKITNNSYCIHLWESMTYDSLKDIETKNNLYNYFAGKIDF